MRVYLTWLSYIFAEKNAYEEESQLVHNNITKRVRGCIYLTASPKTRLHSSVFEDQELY